MSDNFLGQILLFGGNFAIEGWALCDGQLLPITQNTALFSLIGTTYGGDGRTTFALPDQRGRLPVGQGQGSGLMDYKMGEKGGTEAVTLLLSDLPVHSHALSATNTDATAPAIGASELTGNPVPTNGKLYVTPGGSPPPTMGQLNSAACGPAGSGQSHSNLMPSLCITFLIALQGIYPSRG